MNYTAVFNYERFGPDDPADLVLAPSSASGRQSVRVTTGYSMTSVSSIVAYMDDVLYVSSTRGNSTQHFRCGRVLAEC